MSDITLDVTGLDVIQDNMASLGAQLDHELAPAGEEIAREILDTEGLRSYPPSTAANYPGRFRMVQILHGWSQVRMGYYVRGDGAYVPARGGGYKALHNSERYGTNFTTETVVGNGFQTTIGNKVSYSPYLGGDNQAGVMGRIGWRKLYDVAVEKIDKLTDILQAYIDRAIELLHLS